MKWKALLVVTLAMFANGCGETPTRGFEAFYSAAVDGRADDALARMDAPLADGLRASAAQSGVTIEAALRGSLVRATLKEIREVSNDGSHAVLEVTDALGQKQLSHMKKLEGRWRLASAP
jgi:hypothetical protein